MARADVNLTLIKASRQGDDVQVRKAVEALAADERAKNHTILADRLLAQLHAGNGRHGAAALATHPLGCRPFGSGDGASAEPCGPDSVCGG